MPVWLFKKDYKEIERIKKQIELNLRKKKQRILRRLLGKEVTLGFFEMPSPRFIIHKVKGVIIKVDSSYVNLKRKLHLEEEVISISLDYIHLIKIP